MMESLKVTYTGQQTPAETKSSSTNFGPTCLLYSGRGQLILTKHSFTCLWVLKEFLKKTFTIIFNRLDTKTTTQIISTTIISHAPVLLWFHQDYDSHHYVAILVLMSNSEKQWKSYYVLEFVALKLYLGLFYTRHWKIEWQHFLNKFKQD